MGTENEEIASTLAARQFLYAMFQSLFGTEPNAEQCAALAPSLRAEAWSAADMEVPAGDSAIEQVRANPQDWVGEYNRLFVGPATLPAPPWESVFASNSDVLFGHGTLDVRNEYRAQGFLPQRYPSVADDHVALELGFMALLAGRAVEAWSEGHPAQAVEALRVSDGFLQRHLVRWAVPWVERLEKNEPESPFTQMAWAMVEFARTDAERLDTLVQAVEAS